MSKVGRPSKDEVKMYPLYGQLNGDVPWLDGCKEYSRKSCLDCPVPIERCPAEYPRFNKGGRPLGSKNKPLKE